MAKRNKAASLPQASIADSVAFATQVALPTWSKGLIVRRPGAVALAERARLDERAVRQMQALRRKYGDGPLLLRLPVRNQAIVLGTEHVRRVLDESPEPFATASSEKRAALSHFEPKNALVSQGAKRAERRQFNERALEAERPVHRQTGHFARIVAEEAERLMANVAPAGELGWDDFVASWGRIVRRVIFGDGAADDTALSDMMTSLRSRANWAFLAPKDRTMRARFHQRVQDHLDRAESGSLAETIARTPQEPETAPSHQVAQWLFAFGPAGMATARALVLLASHRAAEARARDEAADRAATEKLDLPFLRATILESLRLWPTTPAVLRQTTRDTQWDAGTMPAGTGVFIYAPFFHRDDENLPFAHRFEPDIWLNPQRQGDWPLIPFSGGPAICPARNLVPTVGSLMLAELLSASGFELVQPDTLHPDHPLPGTLDNFALRFRLRETASPRDATG
ncbi:cytochrome P450 [Lutibaculum baratangense]|uniref:Cytochrome P450 monooxygenase n=1 Tax=Lutibaculum baratangense AMV1 TaxID=631454 RepID=V4RSE6_9HYPH|nr:cytochrome P450 [Lutibaculum baratangense]ESR26060.1 cytochrome P450 monooxygenase [Lutibaculum baratangense AMV1]